MRPALPGELIEDPFGFVRNSCAHVAAHSTHVSIDLARLEAWSRALPAGEIIAPAPTAFPEGQGPQVRAASGGARREARMDDETGCAFVIQLGSINFGSGWFPVLRKRPGLSGYRTIEAGLIERFAERGAPSAQELAAISAEACSELFAQRKEAGELMALFARAWNDLGELVLRRFDGSFAALVASADGSPQALVRTLLEMPFYRDVAKYDGSTVAFLKRAQITVSDLEALRPGSFRDLHELTIFADNLVPHVLRLDGVLRFEPELVRLIESGALIEWGSREEIEIRACAVRAVELVESGFSSRQLDNWLWTRGGRSEYKAQPRHRTRCVYY